jgi:hypothetical protein
MSEGEVVKTLYGKNSTYEVIKSGESKYYIYKDGKLHRGYFPSLRVAVEEAEKESGDKR